MRPSASCEWPEQNRLKYGFGTSVSAPVAGSQTRSTHEPAYDPEYISTLPVCSRIEFTATTPSSKGGPHCPGVVVAFATETAIGAEAAVAPTVFRAMASR